MPSQPVSCIDLNSSTANNSKVCEENFGEQPLSYRSILKRFVTIYQSQADFAANSGYHSYRVDAPILPRNNMPFGSANSLQDLYSYFRPAYMAMRGSVRYRPRSSSLLNGYQVKVSLEDTTTSATGPAVSIENDGYNTSLLCGTVTFVPSTNGGVEVELPMYTSNLWLFSFSNETLVDDLGVMETSFYRNFSINIDQTPSIATTHLGVALDFAIGEDFSFMRFQGSPMYSHN